jgi:ribosomal protein S20
LAVKKLDQAAADHLIHVNTSSRLKSRLAAVVKKVQQPSAA